MIPRFELFHKLIHAGIDGKILRIIKIMYLNIKSCLQPDGQCSTYFPSGENLSPILFSYYLNDLQDFLSSQNNEGIKIEYLADNMIEYLKILVLLYADDTIILAKTADDFQKCLNDFSETKHKY